MSKDRSTFLSTIWSGVFQLEFRWEFIKQNKKVRKQENKKKRKKTWTRPRKWSRKKESFFFFLGRDLVYFFSWPLSFFFLFFFFAFLVESVFSFFFSLSLSWSKASFLVFFYKFPPLAINRINIDWLRDREGIFLGMSWLVTNCLPRYLWASQNNCLFDI